MPAPNFIVHFVYIVPSDLSAVAEQAITNSALHLQAWYRWQMTNKAFTLHDPVCEVHISSHPAAWFPNNPIPGADPSGWYWGNVLQDAYDLAGVGFFQYYDDWVVYVDSNPNPGQYAGGTSGGYTSGVAVLGAKDLASLQGIDPDWTQCRGIGGSGHELGHTFGLPHPPPGSPDWATAIMGVGYTTYPSAILTALDKQQLNINPFFAHSPALHPPDGLCPFNPGRNPPTPRPHPPPSPRPA